jgi:hypothetical protein
MEGYDMFSWMSQSASGAEQSTLNSCWLSLAFAVADSHSCSRAALADLAVVRYQVLLVLCGRGGKRRSLLTHRAGSITSDPVSTTQ